MSAPWFPVLGGIGPLTLNHRQLKQKSTDSKSLKEITMNTVFTHPGQPQMQVEVILASKPANSNAPAVYTIRMRYPRIIHGEIMTHRKFSRNARSSRAVPVKTMLNEVRTMPFIPWHWGANQKGMQAGAECNELVALSDLFPHADSDNLVTREEAWLRASDAAADAATAFMDANYHKQIPNRLLEPFAWIDTLITSTDWSNFLWLRDHKDAEPHLQDLARLVQKAINAAKIDDLYHGEWHLPYITVQDRILCSLPVIDSLRKISAARCARISYKPFNGDASYEAELERYESLVTSDRVHASPTEHQATPDEVETWGNTDWVYAEKLGIDLDKIKWHRPSLHGNLNGWIQYRKMIPNEHA
jgi:hypothetical protein